MNCVIVSLLLSNSPPWLADGGAKIADQPVSTNSKKMEITAMLSTDESEIDDDTYDIPSDITPEPMAL